MEPAKVRVAKVLKKEAAKICFKELKARCTRDYLLRVHRNKDISVPDLIEPV